MSSTQESSTSKSRRCVYYVAIALIIVITIGCGSSKSGRNSERKASVIEGTIGITENGSTQLIRVKDGFTTRIVFLPAVPTVVSVSPNGDMLAFDSGSRDIWIANSRGGKARRIENLPSAVLSSNADPSWSPNNKTILFSCDKGLYIVEITKSRRAPRLIYAGRGIIQSTWSRDGELIAFVKDYSTKSHEGVIWTITNDGEGLRKIHPGLNPSLSPDSKRLAFEMRGAIYVGNIGDSKYRELVSDGTEPVWSPDGDWIAYKRASICNDAACDYAVWRIRSKGGKEIRVASGVNESSSLFWTRATWNRRRVVVRVSDP